jgi:hypothetical protein
VFSQTTAIPFRNREKGVLNGILCLEGRELSEKKEMQILFEEVTKNNILEVGAIK